MELSIFGKKGFQINILKKKNFNFKLSIKIYQNFHEDHITSTKSTCDTQSGAAWPIELKLPEKTFE